MTHTRRSNAGSSAPATHEEGLGPKAPTPRADTIKDLEENRELFTILDLAVVSQA